MTVFVFLALAAALVLLVLEGAWLVRVPPHKYGTLLRRSIYICFGLVVLGMVVDGAWHWSVAPLGVALLFGDLWHQRLVRNPTVQRVFSGRRDALGRFFSQARTEARATASGPARAKAGQATAPPRRDMTPEIARRILGLPADATEQQIKEAHRRLMRRVHPDRGGSAAKAAQINRAKDVLLGN